MTTRYQLEILNPVSGVWTPCGPPARSMTAATLAGLRMVPARDMRVVQVETEDDEPVGPRHWIRDPDCRVCESPTATKRTSLEVHNCRDCRGRWED